MDRAIPLAIDLQLCVYATVERKTWNNTKMRFNTLGLQGDVVLLGLWIRRDLVQTTMTLK